jgi:hypothetical protein
MTRERKAQWERRLRLLRLKQSCATRAARYDKADRAYSLVQHAIEQWANEVFAAYDHRVAA